MNNSGSDGDDAGKPHGTTPPQPESRLPPSPISGYRLPASKMFRPGKSGNPGGAVPGRRISSYLVEFGQMSPEDWPDPANLPANARIAISQLRRAMSEEDGLPAAQWAADRVEGGVDRTIRLTRKEEPTMSAEEAMKIIRDADASKLEKF